MIADSLLWTTRDLEVMPDHGGWQRYEIVAGELLVTRAPHLRHQDAAGNLQVALSLWSKRSGLGRVFQTPGVILSPYDAVIPDLIWVSQERLAMGLDAAGHLTVAPDLAVEILSPGEHNQQRDREIKLKLYSRYGVQEYWIVSWQLQTLEIYRRDQGQLQRMGTLMVGDNLTSPLWPGFGIALDQIFDWGDTLLE